MSVGAGRCESALRGKQRREVWKGLERKIQEGQEEEEEEEGFIALSRGCSRHTPCAQTMPSTKSPLPFATHIGSAPPTRDKLLRETMPYILVGAFEWDTDVTSFPQPSMERPGWGAGPG